MTGKAISKKHDDLTAAERAALELAAKGLSDAEIAMELNIGPKTISKRLELVREKLYVRTREAAIIKFMEMRA
jgi:DNA-binding CsgD family transcriptional regulator